MKSIHREILQNILHRYGAMNRSLWNGLALSNARARHAFSAMYLKKPLAAWTDEEREATLADMLGYDLIVEDKK